VETVKIFQRTAARSVCTAAWSFSLLNAKGERSFLPLGGAFHEFAFPETARQFTGGYGEKQEIYSQKHSDRSEEVCQDFHVTCNMKEKDFKNLYFTFYVFITRWILPA